MPSGVIEKMIELDEIDLLSSNSRVIATMSKRDCENRCEAHQHEPILCIRQEGKVSLWPMAKTGYEATSFNIRPSTVGIPGGSKGANQCCNGPESPNCKISVKPILNAVSRRIEDSPLTCHLLHRIEALW
jgi:hypothetical protein